LVIILISRAEEEAKSQVEIIKLLMAEKETAENSRYSILYLYLTADLKLVFILFQSRIAGGEK